MRLLARIGEFSYKYGKSSYVDYRTDNLLGIDLTINANKSLLKLFDRESFIDSHWLHVNKIELKDFLLKSIKGKSSSIPYYVIIYFVPFYLKITLFCLNSTVTSIGN